jgi:hypothetical protein
MPPIVNPFAQINASLPPLVPNPADLAPPPVNIPDDGSALQKIPQTSTGTKVFHPVTPQEREGQMLSGRLEQDYQKDLQPWGTPDNHPGVWGKIGHALSVATGGPNRRLREEAGLENRVNSLTTQEQENELRAAQAGEVGARTGLTEEQTKEMPGETASKERLEGAQADKLENPADKYTFQQTDHGLMRIDNASGVATPVMYNGQSLNPFNKAGEEPPKTIQLQVGGKPHQMAWDAKTGKYDLDQGESGEKPPSVNVNENHAFAEEERGRGLLDKAEANYRTAQQGANTIRDMVGMADAGNKMSAQMLPLEGALEITTAQGVHRINRTEVEQFAGAGSLFDRVQGELGKLTQGQPIPPNIRSDIRKLADAQEASAYHSYLSAHDSAVKRYHLQGEEPVGAPGGGQQPQGGGEQRQRPANVPEGYVYKDGPKGKGWYAPAAK